MAQHNFQLRVTRNIHTTQWTTFIHIGRWQQLTTAYFFISEKEINKKTKHQTQTLNISHFSKNKTSFAHLLRIASHNCYHCSSLLSFGSFCIYNIPYFTLCFHIFHICTLSINLYRSTVYVSNFKLNTKFYISHL